MAGRWPSRLWIVRHGESAGNVARDAAQASGASRIALDVRDVDVPLSAARRGAGRARSATGSPRARGRRPEVLLVSPYVRAQATARLFRESGGWRPD